MKIYLLINKDNSVNFICHSITEDIVTDGLEVVEIEAEDGSDITNGIPKEMCVFDWTDYKIKNCAEFPELLLQGADTSVWEQYVRGKRNALLKKMDKVISNPIRFRLLEDEDVTEIEKYRADLLDITEQEGFPYHLEWPEEPSALKGA